MERKETLQHNLPDYVTEGLNIKLKATVDDINRDGSLIWITSIATYIR